MERHRKRQHSPVASAEATTPSLQTGAEPGSQNKRRKRSVENISGEDRPPARDVTIDQDASARGEDRPPSIDTPTEYACSICQDLSRWRTMKNLPCDHAFHKVCIDKWLRRNIACPLCISSVQEATVALDANTSGRHQPPAHEATTVLYAGTSGPHKPPAREATTVQDESTSGRNQIPAREATTVLYAGTSEHHQPPSREATVALDANTGGRHRLPSREETTVQDASTSGEDRPRSVDTPTEHRCSICLDSLHHRRTVYLPCFHAFHTDYIGTWLNETRTCPMCRTNVLMLEENSWKWHL